MKYIDFTDKIQAIFGTIDYVIVGRMSHEFTLEFILRCAKKFPNYKMNLTPKQKALYLYGICKKNAIYKDVIGGNNLDLNSNDFKS